MTMLTNLAGIAACVCLPIAFNRYISAPDRRRGKAPKPQGACACGTPLPPDNPDDICAQCAAW